MLFNMKCSIKNGIKLIKNSYNFVIIRYKVKIKMKTQRLIKFSNEQIDDGERNKKILSDFVFKTMAASNDFKKITNLKKKTISKHEKYKQVL